MRAGLIVAAVFASVFAFAAEKDQDSKQHDRKPSDVSSSVEVQMVKGSGAVVAEKWVDYKNRVVCYVAGGTSAGAMSCVQIDNPK